jgi:hypothetical protein
MDVRPLSDEQAIERYRYMLRTAPPETIEQAHAEAFAKLTESQRREVLKGLREVTPPREYEAAAGSGDPQFLARMATRAEIRQPGTLERLFGGTSGSPGFGSMLAGSLLGSIAGTVLGSIVAQHFLAGSDSAEASPTLGYGDQTRIEDVVSEDFDGNVEEIGGDDMDIEV